LGKKGRETVVDCRLSYICWKCSCNGLNWITLYRNWRFLLVMIIFYLKNIWLEDNRWWFSNSHCKNVMGIDDISLKFIKLFHSLMSTKAQIYQKTMTILFVVYFGTHNNKNPYNLSTNQCFCFGFFHVVGLVLLAK
jgi:hypothetical protein